AQSLRQNVFRRVEPCVITGKEEVLSSAAERESERERGRQDEHPHGARGSHHLVAFCTRGSQRPDICGLLDPLMADALIVLLLLAGADAKDATAPAMTAAARRALGPAAVVLVDERPELPADAEALTLGARVQARGVVEVMWSDVERQTARLHVHVAE